MRPGEPISTDLVLLGAGHAHVEVLRRFALRQQPGVRLTLIGREPETPYTGMLPGLIRGDYTFEQAHIDLAPLAVAAHARLIVAEATAIELAERQVTVTGRPAIPFDLLSVDLGGEPAMPPNGGQPVKPIGQFLARLSALEEQLSHGARIAVVGGGAGGTELALALARRYRNRVHIKRTPAAVRRKLPGRGGRAVGHRRGGTFPACGRRPRLRRHWMCAGAGHAAKRQPSICVCGRRLCRNRRERQAESRRLGGARRRAACGQSPACGRRA